MLKKYHKFGLLSLAIALSTSFAFAQKRPNECIRPNAIIEKTRGPIEGELKSHVTRLSGKNLEGAYQDAFAIKNNIFQVWNLLYCRPTEYNYTFQDCFEVDPDAAMGRGNDDFKFIFNEKNSLFTRAKKLTEILRFANGRPVTEKERIALALLEMFDRSPRSINNWQGLGVFLEEAVSQSIITPMIKTEIFEQFGQQNRRALGLIKDPSVQINEGRGNKVLKRLFNLNLSLLKRAEIVQRQIRGIRDERTALDLAQHLIREASNLGIPQSWAQFMKFFISAEQKGIITSSQLELISTRFELKNREAFGFEIVATKCVMKTVRDIYNKVVRKVQKDIIRTVAKRFELRVSNAPLTSAEKIDISIQSDGLDLIGVASDNPFVQFAKARISQEANVYQIDLKGIRRNQVTPPNSLQVAIKAAGSKKININIVDNDFEPAYKGRTQVVLEIVQKRLFNKKLKTITLDLVDGQLNQDISVNLKRKKKVFVRYRLKRLGSPFFNTNASGEQRSNTAKMQ